MSTFKSELFALCGEIAGEFENWNFVSGNFKNKSLKHTSLVVSPGFSFGPGNTPFQPWIELRHKKSMALFKKIIGYEISTSLVSFQQINPEYLPEKMPARGWIHEDKERHMRLAPSSYPPDGSTLDITETPPVLRAMIKNGIAFIEKHYDLSSEENFLRNLPVKYVARHSKTPYDEMDMQKGVMFCIVRILLGDFDFIEHYRSDAFKTSYPKRIAELDKIIAVLPDLKKRYAETGRVI